MTNSMEEIERAECLLVVGSNTTEAHPVLALRMKKAMRNGATLIVVDPRRTWLAERADVHLQLRPGTDIPLKTRRFTAKFRCKMHGLLHFVTRCPSGLILSATTRGYGPTLP